MLPSPPTVRVVAILLLLAAAGALRAAAEPTLTAGAAGADITPDPNMLNWVVPRPYGSINDPLFVRAVVISDGTTRMALLTWDLLDAREYAVERVRKAVTAATGIPEANVLVNASHNHSGPQTEMGPEREPPRSEKRVRPAQNSAIFRAWADRLVETCARIAKEADAARRPARLHLGRAWAGDWMFNRRPVRPDGKVTSMASPANPYALPDALRFGTVDPTMTILSLRDADGKPIATLLHVPIHAVSIYPTFKGISADWPGRAVVKLREKIGGEVLFLQGCAGDIVPARRGFIATEEMTDALATRAAAAYKLAAPIGNHRLRLAREQLKLPATDFTRQTTGLGTLPAEVQAVTFGPLALVTLPGEPLQELSTAIQQQSPFPHTVVLGYSNGRGVGYVGLPGGKAKGGYEMSEVGTGTDEAGGLLVEAAVRLLKAR